MDDELATNTRRAPKKPVIVIVGSTGTGKSNLAVTIAKHLASSSSLTNPLPAANQNGILYNSAEIVNADAMQLYDGLPIITNKIAVDEQENVPHHLLGGIALDQETWTVNRFVKEADKHIQDIHSRGKTPIVVGGTGYYVHGLLLDGSALDPRDVAEGCTDIMSKAGIHAADLTGAASGLFLGTHDVNTQIRHEILDAPTEEIYAKLQEVDPDMAMKWHPKDRRKIQRSLEIWLKTGNKASEVYALQKNIPQRTLGTGADIAKSNISLRYNSLIIWLDAEDIALKERLNDRVDAMLEKGLRAEAREMAITAAALADMGTPIDKGKGIWASIGYKELEPLIEAENSPSSPEMDPKLDELCRKCVEDVKAGTRRYAKRQNRYIRIRLADALAKARASDRLFLLDCSNLLQWRDLVESPACALVDDFLSGKDLPQPQSLSDLARNTFQRMDDERTTDSRYARHCETCDKILMTEKEWDKHVISRSHKKILESARRRARLQATSQICIDETVI